MSYTVDLSQSYQFVEGVETVAYAAAGISSTNLQARRGEASKSAYGSSDYEASPTEMEWTVWPYGLTAGQDIIVNGTMTDSNNTVWTILEILGKRADGSQVHVRTIKAVG